MTSNSTTHDESRIDPSAICTLPPDGMAERLAWIRAEILPHALSSERSGDRIVWEFEDTRELAAALDRLVAKERECCSAILFEHRTGGASGRRRLEVGGIDPASSVFAELTMPVAESPGFGVRLAKSIGFGTVASLLVCCVLPIGAVALLGAAAAAPVASLDNPWAIGVAALLSGGAAFAWLGRRRIAASAVCGSDC